MSEQRIVWGSPPPVARKKIRKPGKQQRFVNALRARPGQWGRYPRVVKGSSSSTQLRKRYPGTEWTTRKANDEGGCYLYGRWVGEVSNDVDNPDFVDEP